MGGVCIFSVLFDYTSYMCSTCGFDTSATTQSIVNYIDRVTINARCVHDFTCRVAGCISHV